jgi:hypothetical protein
MSATPVFIVAFIVALPLLFASGHAARGLLPSLSAECVQSENSP